MCLTKLSSVFMFCMVFLIGCGGSSETTPPPPLVPTISLSASSETISINTEFTLSWSSTNTVSCTASDDWRGSKPTSGSESVTGTQVGIKRYTVLCEGEGGEASSSVDVQIVSDDETGQWDYINVAYGSDDPDRQWLNIHLPYDQTTPSPIYVFAHGNGGTAYGMSEKQLHTTASAGYATISWESIPTISSPEEAEIGVADAQIMFDWVKANAENYNLDPNHIVVGGRSRGSIISWQLAHSNDPSIKGIYMYNALPQSTWQNVDIWNPVDEITINSPITYLVYGPDFDDDDGHNPVYVDPVLERFDELGISDKITRYVDMWGDFKDGSSSGDWTNDGEIMHYFPEFVSSLTGTSAIAGDKMMLMGHSFFRPFADELPYHAERAGIVGHSQNVEFSGGQSGSPLSLWEDPVHRANVQAVLDSGNVDVFGMTCCDWELTPEGDRVLDPEGNPILSLEGWQIWFDYALAQNTDSEFFIGIPWLDYPTDYADAQAYADTWQLFYNSMVLPAVDDLRALYPGVTIYTIPYGEGVIELRKMFEAGNLLDITNLEGPSDTSLFTDYKGHGGQLLKDLVEYIWLDAIYGVNLETYDYDDGYQTNLKAIAKSIMDAHNPNYNGPNR